MFHLEEVLTIGGLTFFDVSALLGYEILDQISQPRIQPEEHWWTVFSRSTLHPKPSNQRCGTDELFEMGAGASARSEMQPRISSG